MAGLDPRYFGGGGESESFENKQEFSKWVTIEQAKTWFNLIVNSLDARFKKVDRGVVVKTAQVLVRGVLEKKPLRFVGIIQDGCEQEPVPRLVHVVSLLQGIGESETKAIAACIRAYINGYSAEDVNLLQSDNSQRVLAAIAMSSKHWTSTCTATLREVVEGKLDENVYLSIALSDSVRFVKEPSKAEYLDRLIMAIVSASKVSNMLERTALYLMEEITLGRLDYKWGRLRQKLQDFVVSISVEDMFDPMQKMRLALAYSAYRERVDSLA